MSDRSIVSDWHLIEDAKEMRAYSIVGAWRDGGRWVFQELMEEYGEWVDVASDRVRSPTHFVLLPPLEPELETGHDTNGNYTPTS